MESTQAAVNNILSLFTNENFLNSKKEEYSSFHIFNSLLGEFQRELNQEQVLLMFYNINLFERCLGYYRGRDAGSGQAIFDLIEQSAANYHPSVQYGMQSLYFAMSAYRDHANGHFAPAIDKLRLALKNAVEQGLSFPLFLTTIGEQWLNVVRVHIRTDEQAATLQETIALLTFGLTGQHPVPGVTEGFVSLESSLHKQMLIHVINSIDQSLRKQYRAQPQVLEQFYRRTAAAVSGLEGTLSPDVAATYRLINLFYTDRAGFVAAFERHFERIVTAPTALQRVVFEMFLAVCNEHALDYASHPNFANFENNLRQTLLITQIEPLVAV